MIRRQKKFLKFYDYYPQAYFVAEINDEIVGYCLFRITPNISVKGITKKHVYFLLRFIQIIETKR